MSEFLISEYVRNVICVAKMSHDKSKGICDKISSLLRQNPKGLRIDKIATKLKIDRSTVYRNLESLELRGKAHYARGVAYPESGESGKEHSSSVGWFERRKERKEKNEKESHAEAYAECKFLGEAFPTMKPLQDFAENVRKARKDLGLEP